jgi:hypothetical protein
MGGDPSAFQSLGKNSIKYFYRGHYIQDMKCIKCNIEQSEDEFYKRARRTMGIVAKRADVKRLVYTVRTTR